ncbi:MAG: hypothetical protein WD669_11405 [Pirellulales bacterium]
MTRTELDPNLKQAVTIGTPVEVVDAATNEVYYLVSAEQFRIIAAAISNDFDPREANPLLEKAMAEDDAVDPLLETYQ